MLENNTKVEVRKAIAAADETSIDLLQQLSEDSDPEVRKIVASNPNTPTKILLKLGEEFPEIITANPIFNLLLLENPQSYFIRLSLARSSTTSDRMLAKLADTREPEYEKICCAVAKNPNTSIDVLEQLANWIPSGYQYFGNKVQICVANNPNTPTFVLEQLARIRDESIRQAIFNHPNVSNTAIEIIRFIEEKPGTPIHILEKLASDDLFYVRRLVAEHPFTPVQILEKLANDSDYYICQLAIKHKNITSLILENLTYRLVEDFKKAIDFKNYDYSISSKSYSIVFF